MKHEWRKVEKDIYLPKAKPELIKIPKFKYLVISGKGNPNQEDFAKRVEALYILSYAIRMMPKSGYKPPGYFEYTVYPLEGVWDLTEEGRELQDKGILKKEELVYEIMIRQPNFVDKNVFDKALEKAMKKDNYYINKVRLEEITDDLSVQMLHIGSYDTEPETFKVMREYINNNSLELLDLRHREIYLSDPRKIAPDKLKTVLRWCVK